MGDVFTSIHLRFVVDVRAVMPFGSGVAPLMLA
jgi:hypothetical protein